MTPTEFLQNKQTEINKIKIFKPQSPVLLKFTVTNIPE